MDEPTLHSIDKRVALLEQSYMTLTTELHKINQSLSRLVWIILAALVTAGLQFVIRGGLA